MWDYLKWRCCNYPTTTINKNNTYDSPPNLSLFTFLLYNIFLTKPLSWSSPNLYVVELKRNRFNFNDWYWYNTDNCLWSPGLPSYHWYLKIFWDCCRKKFIDSNLMALRVVITSITTSKVRLTLPSFLLHPQNHFIVYCILYRLEFYTVSRNWLPLVNFSQQPKSSQYTDIFLL